MDMMFNLEEALKEAYQDEEPLHKKKKKPPTPEQMKAKSKKQTERAKLKRAAETPEEATARRALRLAKMKASDTPEKIARRRKYESEWHKRKLARLRETETPEETAARRKRECEYIKMIRARATPEQIERRRQFNREYYKMKKALQNQTPEVAEAFRLKENERVRILRKKPEQKERRRIFNQHYYRMKKAERELEQMGDEKATESDEMRELNRASYEKNKPLKTVEEALVQLQRARENNALRRKGMIRDDRNKRRGKNSAIESSTDATVKIEEQLDLEEMKRREKSRERYKEKKATETPEHAEARLQRAREYKIKMGLVAQPGRNRQRKESKETKGSQKKRGRRTKVKVEPKETEVTPLRRSSRRTEVKEENESKETGITLQRSRRRIIEAKEAEPQPVARRRSTRTAADKEREKQRAVLAAQQRLMAPQTVWVVNRSTQGQAPAALPNPPKTGILVTMVVDKNNPVPQLCLLVPNAESQPAPTPKEEIECQPDWHDWWDEEENGTEEDADAKLRQSRKEEWQFAEAARADNEESSTMHENASTCESEEQNLRDLQEQMADDARRSRRREEWKIARGVREQLELDQDSAALVEERRKRMNEWRIAVSEQCSFGDKVNKSALAC